MAETDVQWMQRFLCFSSSNIINETEVEDIHYTCPFCYVDFDIGKLCSHLEEEHCFEPNAVSCPICSAKVGEDLVGHIQLQHGQLFKMHRRRKSRKAETLLSSQSLAASEEDSLKISTTSCQDTSRSEASLSRGEEEKKMEEDSLRVEFIRQLMLSVIFNDEC